MFIDTSGLCKLLRSNGAKCSVPIYSSTSTLRSAGAPNNMLGAESINIWLLWSQNIALARFTRPAQRI
jgi:hypothetical protein